MYKLEWNSIIHIQRVNYKVFSNGAGGLPPSPGLLIPRSFGDQSEKNVAHFRDISLCR